MNSWILITGWTLVHFIWQGALIGAAAAVALLFLRDASSRLRYVTACVALGAMLASPLVTARLLSRAAPVALTTTTLDSPSGLPSSTFNLALQDQARSVVQAGVTRMHLTVDRALPLIVTIWMTGVLCLFVRLLGGWRRVRRLHRTSLTLAASIWQPTGERLAMRLRMSPLIRIVDSDLVDTPTLIGWVRPVILLPLAALASLTPSQVDAILAHELAHIRRHDFLVNLLQIVAETLLFYHPAVWWVSARIRDEREHCCDDVVVDVCGDSVGYASALAELEAWRIGQPALALGSTGGSLRQRVRRLLHVRTDDERISANLMMSAGFVLLFVAVAGALQQRPAATDRAMLPERTAAKSATFDVAVIRRNESGPGSFATVFRPGGRFIAHNVPLRLLIAFAYRLPHQNVSGGPSWIDTDRFDVEAKAETEFRPIIKGPGSEPEELMTRVRTLLADRVKLVVHHETEERPVYALVLASQNATLGPQLHKRVRDCAAEVPGTRRCGIDNVLPTVVAGVGLTMSQLAAVLTNRLGTPVLDRTGLVGGFDLDLQWTPDEARQGPRPAANQRPDFLPRIDPNGPSIFTAIQEQLGLKLESTKEPIDVLLIDHVEYPRPD